MLSRMIPLVPNFRNYFEPFLGGGALFFELASSRAPFRAFLSDSNAQLINVYTAVRDHVEELITLLRRHQDRYARSPAKNYYRMRDEWENELTLSQAARLIALNRTCYNGLFRVNSKGRFNVPIGRYSNPSICNPDRLRAACNTLSRTSARIEINDFEEGLRNVSRGDFVYLDPPFDPLSKTSNFVGYTESGFGIEDQRRVSRVFEKLDSLGCRVLLSNSDTPLVRELYSEFTKGTVVHSSLRAINCEGSKRTDSEELLIANYSI